jgi:hypothetical protein
MSLLQLRNYIEQCHYKVGIQSNHAKWKENEHYKLALGLGPGIIPMLLMDMETAPTWVHILLLNDLTVENRAVIAKENYGKFRKIVETWLQWGRENQYI